MAEANPPALQAMAAQGAEAAPVRAEGDSPAPIGRTIPASRQAYAAIDLGTNNCRLLIARPAGENFAIVDAFSRVVRLGEGLAQTAQ